MKALLAALARDPRRLRTGADRRPGSRAAVAGRCRDRDRSRIRATKSEVRRRRRARSPRCGTRRGARQLEQAFAKSYRLHAAPAFARSSALDRRLDEGVGGRLRRCVRGDARARRAGRAPARPPHAVPDPPARQSAHATIDAARRATPIPSRTRSRRSRPCRRSRRAPTRRRCSPRSRRPSRRSGRAGRGGPQGARARARQRKLGHYTAARAIANPCSPRRARRVSRR